MSSNRKTLTVDSVSTLRLYLLSIPALTSVFAFTAASDSASGIVFQILTVLGVLLVMLRLTVSFNPKTEKISWKFGILFPLVKYKTISFKDVARLLRASRSQWEHMQIGGGISAAKTNTTYYRIGLVLKSNNQSKIVLTSENKQKIDECGEKIAEILSFEERPNAGDEKRQWSRASRAKREG